jgi:hypothetical protein
MKVELDQTGKLCIAAQTGVEAYALQRWWDNFQRGDLTSVLCIRTTRSEEEDVPPAPFR